MTLPIVYHSNGCKCSNTNAYRLTRRLWFYCTVPFFKNLFSFFSITAITFQENLLKTMIQMENTFFALAERFNRDCIIICDRGTMDASACKFPFDSPFIQSRSAHNLIQLFESWLKYVDLHNVRSKIDRSRNLDKRFHIRLRDTFLIFWSRKHENRVIKT